MRSSPFLYHLEGEGFCIIRRSVSKTDKNDARALAFFMSKGLLPRARAKSPAHAEVMSLVHSREKLVQLRVALQNKVHAIMVAHGLKARKETLGTPAGFEREVLSQNWSPAI